MMEEQTEQTEQTEATENADGSSEGVQSTMEVVPYVDVLDAVDRAAELAAQRAAVDTHGLYERNAADVDAETDAAVAAAIDAAAEKASEDAAISVADRYDAALGGVRDVVREEVEQKSLDGTEVTATIGEDQWEYISQQMQVSSTLSVLSLLMVSMLAGILLSRVLVERWRT